ncbi:MAG: hypothetical protein IT548_04290 [Alphaproteobacteria bacterium]|nr:hypothetical protein [Alphaproteobacteria bacterium]
MPNADWIAFFTAEVGATAALAGLVIVAISINLARILSFPHLPGRAAEMLVILIGALLVSSFMLFPAGILPRATYLALALATWTIPVGALLRDLRKGALVRATIGRAVLAQLPTVPMLVGGWLMTAGDPAGIVWLAFAVLLALVAAMVSTWVLLVEILR